MHFARVARLHDERATRACAFPYELVMDAGRGQQAGNRRPLSIDATVRQDDDGVARSNGRTRPDFQLFERPLESAPPLRASKSIGSVIDRNSGS